MKNKVIAVLLCCGMVASLAACGDQNKETIASKKEQIELTKEKIEEIEKQKKLDLISPNAYGEIDGLDLEPGTYFSLIGKSNSEEYWKTVKAGADAAVADLNKALGYKGDDRIRVVYSGPDDPSDVDGQVNILDEELSRYPSALGVALIDSQSCNVQFDLASENGIPIVIYDSASSYQGIMAEVTTDNQKAATEAAVHMAEALEDEGQVLVVGHDSKSTTSVSRVTYFVDELTANHPNMSATEAYYVDDLFALKERMAMEQLGVNPEENPDGNMEEGQETNPVSDDQIRQTAEAISDQQVYEYLLEKNPEAKGIYATNGRAVMNMQKACERLGIEDMIIMGYDGDKEELEALEAGKVHGLVVQNAFGMGYATIIAEARCVLGLGNEAKIDSGYTWVE